MFRSLLAVSSLFAASCSFEGAPPQVSERDCSWTPANFEPCDHELGVSLDISDDAIFNTTDLTLTVGGAQVGISTSVLDDLEPPVMLVLAESIVISDGTEVRVEGERPLLLASDSIFEVSGVIDVGAALEFGAAGSNPTSCATSLEGTDDIDGAGGGGGGGFGGAGGDGITGDSDNGQAPGGPGGAAVPAPSSPRGGCSGGRGGNGDGLPAGAGGAGGGAIQLAARDSIGLENAVIDARGGGGGGARGGDGAGGGGGSGGFIRLDAPRLVYGPGVVITANGGGGGGGSGGNQDIASPGENGLRSSLAARGGAGTATINGGADGGSRDAGNDGKTIATIPNTGAGGGGGGVGHIILTELPDPSFGAVISPESSAP